MRNNELMLMVETLRKLYRRSATHNMEKIIGKLHPADIALMFRSFTQNEQSTLFRLVGDLEVKAEVLSELDDTLAVDLLNTLEDSEIIRIFREMDYDDESNLLRLLPEERQNELLEQMKDDELEEIAALMEYKEDTAGSIMTPEIFCLHEDATAEEAIQAIRDSAETEMVFYIYVIDARNHLVGVVSLRQLILVAPKTRLKNIMSENVVSVVPETDQEEAARIISRYNFLALPVVDKENKILGLITVDDIIDVMREEATEDLLQMAGVGRDTDIILKSAWETARIRFPWLFATWIGGLVAASVIGLFHNIISQLVLLSSFIPIIAGMGGNIGTQSSTIITRGLATGRVNEDNYWKLIFKESRVGGLLGLLYGLFLGLISFLVYGANIYMALTFALGLGIAMMLATFTGTAGPIALSKLKVDPAIATGPFVTTTIDILGITIYLSIASFFSSMIIP